MKRVYSKPALIKETFELETQIATNCKFVTNTLSLAQQCNYPMDKLGNGYFIFAEGWTSCIDEQFEDGNAIYCYHAGINNIFNS